MEIKQVSSIYQAMAYEASASQTKKQTSSNTTADTESVELSENSQNLQKVKEAVNETPEIRIPIVEEIKKRIKNNDYPIDTHTDNAIDNMIMGNLFSCE